MRRVILASVLAGVFALGAANESGAVSSGIFGVSGAQGFNCTACHTGAVGSSASFTMMPVNSVLPPTTAGYVPGATYDVTVMVTGGPGSLYGFDWFAGDTEVVASPLGEGVLTDAVNTQQPMGDPTFPEFTHTSTGTSLSSWSFQWKAPVGEGTVRLWLSGNSANASGDTSGDAGTVAVTLDLDPLGEEVVTRFGNVNGDLDDVVNVLTLNGSTGDDERIEGVTVGGALDLDLIDFPGSGGGAIPYALYVLLKENDAGDATPLPMSLGTAPYCFLNPDSKVLVRVVANLLGHEPLLGTGRFSLPAGPGPLISTSVPVSIAGRRVTFMALVPDSTAGPGASITNSIVMDVP